MDAKRFVTYGPGYSGDTDELQQAIGWLKANRGNGAIYVKVAICSKCHGGGNDDTNAGMCDECDGDGYLPS